MECQPTVSVCIPAYSRPAWLDETIESVLSQTFQDLELLVVDDKSPYDLQSVVGRRSDPRIRYVRNEQNVGMNGNRNRCVELARGKYVIILDDDDLFNPEALQLLTGALDAHPEAGFAFGWAEVIDADANRIGVRRKRVGGGLLAPETLFAHLLAIQCPPSSAVLVRSTCYAAVGSYEGDENWCADWAMLLRIAGRFPAVYVDEPVLQYRLSPDSSTLKAEQDGSAPASMRLTIRKALAMVPAHIQPPPRVIRQARLTVARYELSVAFGMLYGGRIAPFRRHLLQALRFAPELLASKGAWAGLALGVASLLGPAGPRALWAGARVRA